MENNLKKLLPLLGVVCLSMTQAFADDYSSNGTMDTCAKMKSAVPPGVNCPCDDGPNVYINAAYTLWTARQEGLAAGIANSYGNTLTFPENVTTSGNVLYPSWKLRSGFKVGLGAYLDHDCWDIGLEYTWFWNKGNGYNTTTAEATATGGANPTGLIRNTANPTAFTTDATANTLQTLWNNWFNRIDAELGRAFYVGHYLSLRPFIGLVGAWEEQSFDSIASTPATTTPQTTPARTVTITNHQKWWGVGPYMGFNTAFIFTNDSCNEWSLFMDSGVALPWTHADTTSNQVGQSDGGTPQNILLNKGSFWSVDPMLELAMGLRWETTWSDCNEWSFMLQAAWEEQVWIGHNRMAVVNLAAGGGNNFSLQGFTLKAQLDF